MLHLAHNTVLDDSILTALNVLRNPPIPSKAGVFSWKLLVDRLPTLDALISRGVIPDPHGSCYSLCFDQDELVMHLFFLCRLSRIVWLYIQNWVDIAKIDSQVGVAHFHHELRIESRRDGDSKYLI